MQIISLPTTEEFVATAVQWIAGTICSAAKDGGRPVIGLSGGSTPQPVYTMLATEQSVPWERVTLFLLDERYVPVDHKDSNTHMIASTLVTRSASAATLIAPDTTLPLQDSVADYDKKIAALHPDLVILGMGQDGHIASLFPPLSPEAFGPATVIATTTDRFAVRDRISVTLPLLERAEKRLFLMMGIEKRALLTNMQSGNEDVNLFPAQYLFDDRTTWIVGP